MTAAKKDILQGWKDIAAYVSRDVRTVKRWEKQRGLPVRRMPGDGRANVYALIPDLDAWLSSAGPMDPEIDSQAHLGESDIPDPDEHIVPEAPVTEISAAPATVQSQLTPQALPSQRRWMFIAAGVVCVVVLGAVALTVRNNRHDQTATDIPPFSPTQTVRTVKYSSKVPGVDALYLRGLYFYEQRTPDTLDRALKCFQQAIHKDPGYAPAYAGLAQTYNLVREYSMMPESEAYAKAKVAAQRAIDLDPSLSEAHASLGFVEFFWDWDAKNAEREFHSAIDLDPNSALAHHWYGSMLTHEGRYDEALKELDLAQRLQPTSISILSDRAFALGMGGHRNEAADMLQEIVNEDPNSPSPHQILANISLVEPTDLSRFLDENRRFSMLRHDDRGLEFVEKLTAAYRLGGAKAMWKAQLEEEERKHSAPNDRTYLMVSAEAGLGQKDNCLRDLAQLADRRDRTLIGMEMDPMLATVRNDSRFIAIADRLGIPVHH